MDKLAEVSKLIGRIYDASLDPRHWQGVLASMCGLMDAKAASIQMFDPLNNNKLRLSMDYGSDPKWAELLHSTYAALCPIGPILLLAELDEAGSIFNYIDEEEFVETRFYKEWCVPQDFHDMTGAILAKSQAEIGTLSVIRSRSKPNFNAVELELLGMITPHVRRAVTIAGLFEHQAIELAGLTTLMQKLSTAIIVVDASGRVLKSNAAAETLLIGGETFRIESGRLAFSSVEGSKGLSDALSMCNGSPAIVPLTSGPQSRLTAAVVSMDAKHSTFAVLVHAPQPTLPAMGKPLVQAFGFTPREVAVLMPVLEGKAAAEIAEALGVSVPTVRTHLASLMEKTKTTRQADLVRVVMQVMSPVSLE
jgi:DNA-binding CsgD family transcriptional regulator